MIINSGASFGLNIPVLGLVSGCFLVILAVFWYKEKKAWGALLVMVGGGLNLIERLTFGGVRDYWQIPLTSIYNNFNDYLIAIGVIQLFWYFLWKKRQK
jgi:lipoprotein signal peptidase